MQIMMSSWRGTDVSTCNARKNGTPGRRGHPRFPPPCWYGAAGAGIAIQWADDVAATARDGRCGPHRGDARPCRCARRHRLHAGSCRELRRSLWPWDHWRPPWACLTARRPPGLWWGRCSPSSASRSSITVTREIAWLAVAERPDVAESLSWLVAAMAEGAWWVLVAVALLLLYFPTGRLPGSRVALGSGGAGRQRRRQPGLRRDGAACRSGHLWSSSSRPFPRAAVLVRRCSRSSRSS